LQLLLPPVLPPNLVHVQTLNRLPLILQRCNGLLLLVAIIVDSEQRGRVA